MRAHSLDSLHLKGMRKRDQHHFSRVSEYMHSSPTFPPHNPHAPTYLPVCMPHLCTHPYTATPTRAHMPTHTHTHVCMYTHTCTRTHVHAHTHKHSHTHMHVDAHTQPTEPVTEHEDDTTGNGTVEGITVTGNVANKREDGSPDCAASGALGG